MEASSGEQQLFDLGGSGSTQSSSRSKYTEPSVNVMLAELLSESGLRAKGEIRYYRRTPDVQLDLHGIQIIIEGKFIGQRSILINQAKQRLQEGIGDVIFLVEYADPGYLNKARDQIELKEKLRETRFNISWLTVKDLIDAISFLFPQENMRFYDPPFEENLRFNELVSCVLSTYETAISIDILSRPIRDLEETLKMFAQDIASGGDFANLAERLKPILELSEQEEEKD